MLKLGMVVFFSILFALTSLVANIFICSLLPIHGPAEMDWFVADTPRVATCILKYSVPGAQMVSFAPSPELGPLLKPRPASEFAIWTRSQASWLAYANAEPMASNSSPSRGMVACGWPRPLAWCEIEPISGGFPLPKGWGASTVLGTRPMPLRPVWVSALGYTLAMASAYILLFIGTRLVRGRLRQARGLCPSCAYRITGAQSSRCPECGESIRRRD